MLRKGLTTGTQDSRRDDLVIAAAGVLPVVWIALKIAPYWKRSVFLLVTRFDEIFAEPFKIQWTEHSLQAVFLCLFVYAMGIGIWLSTRRNYRRGEEHGSAKWGDAAVVNRKYRQHPANMNKYPIRLLLNSTDNTFERVIITPARSNVTMPFTI